MTAPIWMASPPEVHSALLSSGPGPASLLAAAGAWSQLSTEYASAAEELSALSAEVQAGAWEGPSSESYVAAHVPYLLWLSRASTNSAAAAAQHETAAAAYTAALAAMPTLPELATNHAVHGALVATNFFGINTIPIALNEADYARMWVQAATTMSTYQAVANTAVAATPQTDPAPQIVKSNAQADPPAQTFSNGGWLSGDNPLGLPPWLQKILQEFGIGNQAVAHDPMIDNWLDHLIANFLQNFGIHWDPAAGTLNGITYDTYTNPGQFMFWVARALELLEDFQQFGYYLVHNPVLAFQYLISLELFDWPLHIEEIITWLVSNPELLVPAIIVTAAPVGALGAFAGLAGLAAIHPPVLPAPVVPAPSILPVIPLAPTSVATFASPASAPAPTPTSTATTVANAAPASTPPAAAGPVFFPPYVVGPPRIGLDARISASATSSAKRKAPEPDAAAAAATASAQEAARARRRQRQRQRGYGDEFMDMNVEVDPDWDTPLSAETVASKLGAGDLGFAGTARKTTVAEAVGLTTLAGDEFGSGPRMPMVPAGWEPDGAPKEESGEG